jgi:hypothetical protein
MPTAEIEWIPDATMMRAESLGWGTIDRSPGVS